MDGLIRKLRVRIIFFLFLISKNCLGSILTVGIGISGPPIAQKVDTPQGAYYFGFCIDLMNGICQNIGKTCDYKDVTINNQFKLLNNHDIDLLILSSPYSAFELDQYAMSIPYAVSKLQFITLTDSNITQLSDLKNKKIAVIKNTFYDLLLQSSYKSDNEIIAYNSTPDLMLALTQHNIDVVGLNNVIAFTMLNNNSYDIKLVGNSIPLGGGYGIIGLQDKAALIDEINNAILKIENNGTYNSIYRKYYEPEQA